MRKSRIFIFLVKRVNIIWKLLLDLWILQRKLPMKNQMIMLISFSLNLQIDLIFNIIIILDWAQLGLCITTNRIWKLNPKMKLNKVIMCNLNFKIIKRKAYQAKVFKILKIRIQVTIAIIIQIVISITPKAWWIQIQ